ncbi:MAG TPA: hypothetical protein VMI54_08090 [Polyangiaceae bacterium]|nr:hypothetical protein [Polyangiaceae bacterium]
MSPLALRAARFGSVFALASAFAAGCSRDIELGADPSGASGGAGGSGGSAGANAGRAGSGIVVVTGGGAGEGGESGASGASGACVPASCHGKIYACGNCKDDDGDGKIDADDPECTGPCDDREDSFDVGLPGGGADKCSEDCFFDNGNGAGNDGCRFSHRCDPLSVAPDYPPTGSASCSYDEAANIPGGGSCAELRAAQAGSCADVCGPLTPNGCDCFGCCEIPAGSGRFVALGGGSGTCTSENLDDSAACPPCTQVPSCLNTCDPCESCVGRPEPLASCTSTVDACDGVFEPCDRAGSALCPAGSYCITGCCVPEPR